MTPRRFELDRIVKWSIVCLCVVLIIDIGVRHAREFFAPPPPERPTRSAGRAAEVPLPADPISLENAATKGNLRAPVAILGYTDFDCPYCSVFARDILPNLEKALIDTGEVRFVLKHLPLDSLHPDARRIAAGSECARQLGKFWEFHDLMFLRKGPGKPDLSVLASDLGLPVAEFSACVGAGVAAAAVDRDSAEAAGFGVNGTPTFFVGQLQSDGRLKVTGRLVGAQSVEAFKTAVAEAAAKPR